MFFYALGIHYLRLKYLVDDNRERITAKRPLRLKLTYRKGRLVLECSVGKSVARIDLPSDIDLARSTAAMTVESLRESVSYVVFEDVVNGRGETDEQGS